MTDTPANAEQREALKALRSARRACDKAFPAAQKAADDRRAAVRAAVDAGLTHYVIADMLGIGRVRVTQIAGSGR